MTPVLYLAVGWLGVSALLAQLTLLRELLAAFSGSELVFGVVLGNWMLLTGIGSALGRRVARLKSPLAALVAVQVLLAVLPIGDVFLLRTLRNVIFVRGVEIGLTDTVVSCFVILAPYCLAVGYALPLASWVLAPDRGAAGSAASISSTTPAWWSAACCSPSCWSTGSSISSSSASRPR